MIRSNNDYIFIKTSHNTFRQNVTVTKCNQHLNVTPRPLKNAMLLLKKEKKTHQFICGWWGRGEEKRDVIHSFFSPSPCTSQGRAQSGGSVQAPHAAGSRPRPQLSWSSSIREPDLGTEPSDSNVWQRRLRNQAEDVPTPIASGP